MRFPALLTLPVLVLLLVAAFAPASVFAARAAAAAFAAPAAAVAFAAPAAAVASADAQRDDAHVGADAVPASILPRIHALERAFGIGEAARRRASASANSTLATLPTLVGQQIDPATGAAVCSSQTCTSCGDLIVGSVGQNIPLVAAAPDSAGTDYYGFQICNTSPSLQFSFGSFSAVCSAANTVFCQYHVADGLTYSIAYATNTPVWTYTNNAVGYYQEGSNDCIPGGVPRAMQITFTCGAGADMITNVIPPANPTLSYCTWQVFISTPLVCGVSSATLNPDANGSSNGESGSGWIIFAVVLAVVIALELACMARRSL